MATATTKGRPKTAATKTPAATTGTRTSLWRYHVNCNGASPSEKPVNQAEMIRQIKTLTTNMSVAKNGKARITIDCTLPAGKTAPMH